MRVETVVLLGVALLGGRGVAQEGWQAASGSWDTAGGLIRQTTLAEAFQILWCDAPERADLLLRARVTPEDGARWLSAGFLLRAAGAEDEVLAYLAAGAERKVQLATERRGRFDYPVLQGRAEWPVQAGQEYALEVRARGPRVELRLDGRTLAVLRDAPAAPGRVGLFTFDCRATFRDVVVEELAPDCIVADSVPLLAPLGGALAPAGQGIGRLIDRAAGFALADAGVGGVTTDPEGRAIPPYLCHAVIRADDDLSYGGAYNAFHHGLFIHGFLDYWVYSGREEFRRRAVALGDWNLARRTPEDWPYGGLPYSTTHGGEVGGLTDGETLQPDKAAYFGLALWRLGRVTGAARFRDAARRIARTLAATQRADGSWPFRVNPRTGEVVQPYTASVVPALRLFDALAADAPSGRLRVAREKALDWLLAGPVRTEEWVGYYEDVGPGARSYDQWMPEEAIRYCLDHRGERPGLLAAAQRMESYVERTFLAYHGDRGPGVREQTACFVPMNFHTLHWALAADALGEATGDELLRRAAESAVNTATWNQEPDGRSLSVDVFERGDWRETWYSLAFSPLTFGLPYLARRPDLAPADEDHLLGHSAEIRAIRLSPRAIEYETDASSSDLIRLRDTPLGVTCEGTGLVRSDAPVPPENGWSFDEAARLLRIEHAAGAVRVLLAGGR